MTPEQNRNLHRLLSLCGLAEHKHALVSSITRGRTESSAAMSELEANEFIAWLRQQDEKLHGRSRDLVKHLLKLMGFDWQQQDILIRNLGSNNPKKKPLANLGGAELNKVVSQIRIMYQKELSRNHVK